MIKLNYLKPVASVLISAVIATAGSVYITSKYLKPDVPGNDEIGRVAASYLVKNPQYLLEAGKALEKKILTLPLSGLSPTHRHSSRPKRHPISDLIMRPSLLLSFSTTSVISVCR